MRKIKRFFRITPIFITLSFCLWIGIILFFYLSKYPDYLLLFNLKNTVLPDLMLLLILSLLAYTSGLRLFSIYRIEFNSLQEKLIFCIGLGFCVLSFLIMGLGFLGLLEPKIAWGLIFGLSVLLFKDLLKVVKETLNGLRTLSFKQFSGLEMVLLFFLVVTCGLCILQGLCPPYDWDDLAYHLPGPKLFLEHHRIFHIQDIAMANLPANIGMLYLLGMLLSSDILAKLFHFLFGILTVIGIISLSRRYFNPKSALLGGCIFYICPLVIFLSRTAYIDLALTFYELLSIYAFLNWATSLNRKWVMILAVMCGFVVGIKYPGIYNVIIFGLSLIGFGIVKLGLRKTLICLAIFISICCLVGCPWYIKNFWHTHNPFYPFLENLFIGKASLTPLEVITAQTSRQAFTMRGESLNSLFLPWNITINGCLGSLPFGATITPVYLLLLPFLIFTRKPIEIYLIFYIILKFILWSLGLHSSRYLLPIFPFLAIVLTGIFYTITSQACFRRLIIFIIIGIWGALLSWDGFQIIHYRNPINFILGFESRDDFIRRNAEKGYYNTIEFINTYLPEKSRIFFIGEKKGYYCRRNYIPDFSPEHWTWKYQNYNDMAGMREYFRQTQITHILVNTKVISCYYYPDNGVSKKDVESFNQFAQTYLKLLYKKGSLYLYSFQ